jgi:hypothetical protein
MTLTTSRDVETDFHADFRANSGAAARADRPSPATVATGKRGGRSAADLHEDRPAGDARSDCAWQQHLTQLDAEDLRRLAASLPVIEQAKGVLMAYYGCDAEAAFAILRRWSSTRNVKLRTVAAAVVCAATRPSSEPFGALRRFLADCESQFAPSG